MAVIEPALASFDLGPQGPISRIQSLLHQNPTAVPFLVMVATIAFFSIVVGERFFAPFNLSLVLQQVTVVGVLGIAETLVVFTAGIDLSVGAIMILSSVVMGRLTVIAGVPVELSLVIGLLVGIACGLANGLLVARLKLQPFIVTLGTWSIYGALVILISHSATIRSQDVEVAAPFLQWLGSAIRLPGEIVLTYSSVLLILLFAFAWYLINRTAFGRHILASGDDASAANLAGINTVRTLIGTYVLSGAICGIAGWVLIGRIGAISPYGSQSSNIDAITAVVIGGTSLFGGRGSVIGTLIGAIIVGVFRNGLALGGVEVLWQEFSVGALIIIAVIIDQWIRTISE